MKNFIIGVGSILDIWPTFDFPEIKKPLTITINSTPDDDVRNLTQDWQNIGNDMRKAMSEFEEELEKNFVLR